MNDRPRFQNKLNTLHLHQRRYVVELVLLYVSIFIASIRCGSNVNLASSLVYVEIY